jgi:flavin-dependent dehydrogenase
MIGPAMPVRATKRGARRTRLDRDCDALICGASFAGLAVARELAGSGARVMMIDRYEVGERQTSACAAPTQWLRALGLQDSIRQTFGVLVVHTPPRTFRYGLPWTFSTFDYRALCATLAAQGDAQFDTAKVDAVSRGSGRVAEGRMRGSAVHTVHTDRGDLRAPLVVDALGWKRVLSSGEPVRPPQGGHDRRRVRLSRGLEVHPPAQGQELEIWIDPRYVQAGYGWSFPAGQELRVGVGSFEPRDHVRGPTMRLAQELGLPPERYQGNWIPHQLRPAVQDGVFFAGDSAGHCLPLTAEGIRTALYFGLACGRELRGVLEGRQSVEQALARYGAFSDTHAWKFRVLLHAQSLIGRVNGRRALDAGLAAIDRKRLVHWMFRRYLGIAPPSFVAPPSAAAPSYATATA